MSESSLVSCEWLEQHLGAPDIVVLDCSWYLPDAGRDPKAEYAEGHIPGALFFDIDAISDQTSNLPHMLPEPHVFAAHMKKMGVGDGQTIVVYDGMGLFSAARVWWMFRLFGVEQVYVLNGGLPKWKAEGRPLSSETPIRSERHFTPRANMAMVRSRNQVKADLGTQGTLVLDARGAPRFAGNAPEPRPGCRAGHMPGAKNLPFGELLQADGQMKSTQDMAQIFDSLGVEHNTQVVTSCGSGVTAAILALGLDETGHKKVALYDGSWADWGTAEDTEVVTGPA